MPRGRKPEDPIKRFWSKVKKTDYCWEWIGSTTRTKKGYGSMKVGERTVQAHRYSYEIHNGQISKDVHVMHICDNTSCVRPDHLKIGSHKDNMQDMSKKGRARRTRGEDSHSAKLTWKSVKRIRKMHNDGHSKMSLGRMFNVTATTIRTIIKNQTWKEAVNG